MGVLICPVCGGELTRFDKSYRCPDGHSYDIARQGYVNLLMSNRSASSHHGDDKMMVKARCDFLDRGYYTPLRDAIIRAVTSNNVTAPVTVDSGCGDCWYTSAVYDAVGGEMIGIDISKAALIAGAKRSRDLTLCVASASRLPVKSQCADLVLNIFSPWEPEEFRRVLKTGGRLIRAVPMERHLWSLKRAVYDRPYENPAPVTELRGFRLVSSEPIRESIELKSNEDIQNLFKMTPYYYKTGKSDQEKLTRLDTLTVELEVLVAVYEII